MLIQTSLCKSNGHTFAFAILLCICKQEKILKQNSITSAVADFNRGTWNSPGCTRILGPLVVAFDEGLNLLQKAAHGVMAA